MEYPFRYDYLKLESEELPDKKVDGSTCYEVDTGILYIAYKNNWYAQE